MADFDYSNESLSKMETERRNESWGAMRNWGDAQRELVQEVLEELYAITNTSDTIMPPIEKFLRLIDVIARGASACYPGDGPLPSDILRNASEYHKTREMITLIELASEGNELALATVQRELRRRMEEMGVPPELLDDTTIIPVSPEDLESVIMAMEGEDNADEEDGPSHKALRLLLGRDGDS